LRHVCASVARVCAVLLTAGGTALLPSAFAAQRGQSTPPVNVPPLSMTCPMHPDIVESSPGDCPICKMKLVPVRLETVWTCPVHPQVVESVAGKCPIDHRDLVQMTVALSWTCQDHPEIDHIDRGVCPDGKPMVAKRTLRPHGNHNPQHGGQFFMAPDNFHHLEGAYPGSRLFRLHLYDDYARPLPVAQLRQVKARVVTRESYDAVSHVTKELASFPLVRRGQYLEARIDSATFPAQMSAKVQFKADVPEYRFDFTFPGFTKDPVRPSASAPSAASTPKTSSETAPLPALPNAPVPAATARACAPRGLAAATATTTRTIERRSRFARTAWTSSACPR
jgi:hypothetical protein